jgi:uncharacterized protein YrzB (UPF0473 family)
MEDKMFTVIDEEGKEVEYEVVLTFKNDEFNKSYVIYKLPGDDVDEVTAAIYDETEQAGGKLLQITSEDEWEMIEEVLNSFLDGE